MPALTWATARLIAAAKSSPFSTGPSAYQPIDLASPAIALVGVYQQLGLQAEPLSDSYYNRHAHQLGLAEVALPPESALLGKTVQGLGFRSEYQLNVVGLRRQGQALEPEEVESLSFVQLKGGRPQSKEQWSLVYGMLREVTGPQQS